MTPSPLKLPISTSSLISIKHKIPIWLLLKRGEGGGTECNTWGGSLQYFTKHQNVSRVAMKNKTMNPLNMLKPESLHCTLLYMCNH